jgi:hypothetical protein
MDGDLREQLGRLLKADGIPLNSSEPLRSLRLLEWVW